MYTVEREIRKRPVVDAQCDSREQTQIGEEQTGDARVATTGLEGKGVSPSTRHFG